MNDIKTEWFYCTKHHKVEPEEGCRAIHRLGPYESYADASHALDRVEERNEEWDADED